MFIKLTKIDNRPVWLNASFIVTVEPRKDGVGSVVVPIGDGFDYDVRESVQEILEKLEGAPAAAVVPVPAPDCLTKAPVRVSSVPEQKRDERPVAAHPVPTPAAVSTPGEEPKPVEAAKPAQEKPGEVKKPRKRVVRKAKAEKADKSDGRVSPDDEDAKKPIEARPVAPLELSPDQVARLAKLAPKSVGKLKNTLATQFHVADVGATVLALEASDAFKLEGTRVLWPDVV